MMVYLQVVELVGNPAVILFTVCILPHPDHGHTRASTTKGGRFYSSPSFLF